MTNMTLAIPEDLHEIIKRHSEIKWSEVARKAMREQAEKLELMDRILSKSKLSSSDVEEISKSVKNSIAKRHGIKKTGKTSSKSFENLLKKTREFSKNQVIKQSGIKQAVKNTRL